MLPLNSASKSGGLGEKCRTISQPLREHELMGLPKSTGKKGLQPVRMKDLLGPIEWERARQPLNNNRRTMMPDTLNNAKRKLHETSRLQTSPSACAAATQGVHLSGLSKSEGKINNAGLDRIRMQPENMKHLMESWEKVQTVERSTVPTKKVEVRNQKVRRKLYSHLAQSPKPVAKNKSIARKSEIKTQRSSTVDVKSAATNNAFSRRSRLVPPNVIRDKYVRQQDAIIEESTLSIEKASLNSTSKTEETIYSDDEKNRRKNRKSEKIEAVTMEDNKTVNDQEIDNLPNSSTLNNIPNDKQPRDEIKVKKIQSVVVRPSVIMGVSAKELQKEKSPKSNDNEKIDSSDSFMLLKELNKNTSLCGEKLHAMEKPLDDNLSNISHCDYSESFYRNLPQNSFLKFTIPTKNSFVHIDSQTIHWIHANLKLQVQSTEEQLFSMKRLLQTLEDLMKDQEKEETQEIKSPIESEDISARQTDEVETKKVEEDLTNEKAVGPVCEIPIVEDESKKSAFKVIVLSSSTKSLSSDRESSPLSQNLDDQDKENKKSVEKPRRRSVRLAEKMSQSPKSLTDSFSSIEKELNIVHVQKKKDTPVKRKSGNNVDPRCRRSVREYMALKSSMNFLATPNVKGYQAAIEEKCTPSRVRSTRRDLSRKLLNELEDLYADSPI